MSTARPRHRLYVPELQAGSVELSGDVVRYVRNVLRLTPGEREPSLVEVFDGLGQYAAAELHSVERHRIILMVQPLRQQAAAMPVITLLVAPPKGERADILVEKAAELGVQHIVWTVCDRAVRTPKESGARNERWQRIALEATRQCGRADVLSLSGPLPLAEALALASPDAPDILRCFAAPGGVPLSTLAPPSGVKAKAAYVAIGPEGGWTARELDLAPQANYAVVSLGSWVLRVETAAIAAAALLRGVP